MPFSDDGGRAVEQRLNAAEAAEPTRQAMHEERASPIGMLATSVANALGCSREDAAAALAYSNGDLEKAVPVMEKAVELLRACKSPLLGRALCELGASYVSGA